MRVLIDDTCCHMFTRSVNDTCSRIFQTFAYLDNFTRFYEYVGIFQHPLFFICPNRRILNQNRFCCCWF